MLSLPITDKYNEIIIRHILEILLKVVDTELINKEIFVEITNDILLKLQNMIKMRFDDNY